MRINDTIINAECVDVVNELQSQLAVNDIDLLQRIRDVGENIMVQCPYHANGHERKPSAGIRKEDGTFHCFACHETHTLPEVISYCFGNTNDILGKEGFKWLIKNFATVQIEDRKDINIDIGRGKPIVVNNKCNYVTEEELDKYRYYHKYWTTRGITDDDIIELFDLGYDKETDCITFPVRDIQGNCLFVARRNVKTKFFNYPSGVDKPLYGLYELGENTSSEIYVTESMIDCILLWQAGYCAVALNGTGSELQFEQLRNLPCRKLILATDNDKAGLYARDRIKKNVRNKIITQIDFPSNRKDIGECTKEEIEHIQEWEVW